MSQNKTKFNNESLKSIYKTKMASKHMVPKHYRYRQLKLTKQIKIYLSRSRRPPYFKTTS